MMERKNKHRRHLRHNLKPGLILLLIPIVIGVSSFGFLFSSSVKERLANYGSKRLITPNQQLAAKAFEQKQPNYERRFAYYQLKTNDNLSKVSRHFSVPEADLIALNPGILVPGTTIKIPPPVAPLAPLIRTNGIAAAKIVEVGGFVVISQEPKLAQINTTLPELAQILKPYNVFEVIGPKQYRLNRPISIEGNIRLDITGDTVSLLQLKSEPGIITCLCLENSELLIKDTVITSYDTTSRLPDSNYQDLRSFVRARKNSRMDIINSRLEYLGSDLDPTRQNPVLAGGGTYGVSWRISLGTLGKDIATGWVENSTFRKNYFGSYTFGASGITWKNNKFQENVIYGLDPHDDSNNALIEGNEFTNNGKHGFIMSVRCNYNIIRNNVSRDNGLHGFMLHESSAYNLVENNISVNNTDNFVVYASDFNAIRNNKSYDARSSHVRINKDDSGRAINNFVTDNQFYGGKRGIHLYSGPSNTLISGNTFFGMPEVLRTLKASDTLFSNNVVPALTYDIASEDKVIFGPNVVKR